jgi:hypothetical protein
MSAMARLGLSTVPRNEKMAHLVRNRETAALDTAGFVIGN